MRKAEVTTAGLARDVPASITGAVLGFLVLGACEFLFGIEGQAVLLGTGLAETFCGLLMLGATVRLFFGGRGARIGLCLLYVWFGITAFATIRLGVPGLTTYPLMAFGAGASVLMFVPSANAYLRS